jgi:hypothetical protein
VIDPKHPLLQEFTLFFSLFQKNIFTLQLALRVDNTYLRDQFEWDALNATHTPEEYAKLMVKDLKLRAEFAPLIAHSIREQIDDHLKTFGFVNDNGQYFYFLKLCVHFKGQNFEIQPSDCVCEYR